MSAVSLHHNGHLGKFPRGVTRLLDDEELGQLGVWSNMANLDPSTEFGIRMKFRELARKAFVKRDCHQRVARSLLRNARPLKGDYKVGDIVCFLRMQTRNNNKAAQAVWSSPSRILRL